MLELSPVLPLSISSDNGVQDVEVYNKISGEVETFLYSQGFSQVTIQPEFPSPDRENSNLKCEVRSAALDRSSNLSSADLLRARRGTWRRVRRGVRQRVGERWRDGVEGVEVIML